MRDSTIFYRSFYESIQELPLESQAKIYNAIFNYSLNGNVSELSGIELAIFTLIKPQLDANNKRYENGKKPKVKPEKSKPEANPKQDESKPEANKNDNVNDNVNDNENNNDNENQNVKNTFPKIEDVISYFQEKGYTVEAAKKAFEFYDVNQWNDSKGNKVKNWKQKMISVWFKDEHKAKPETVKPKYATLEELNRPIV